MLLARNVPTVEETVSFEGITRIEFDLHNAPVTITGSTDVEEVTVHYQTTTGLLGGSTRLDPSGWTLRIAHRCPFLLGFACSARYELVVPEGTTIDGGTSNGAIRATNLAGDFSGRTSNGAISLEGMTGQVNARTSNGAIQGEDMRSSNVTLQTSNGRIVISFTGIPQAVDLRTSNGAIDVQLPGDAPAFALSTTTSNGRVDTGIRTDPAASQRIDARTSNGNITIRYR